jgi:putative FmdB family regulatory protein
MPIYAYRCASCGHAKDVLQKLSDPPLTQCPSCGAQAFSKQLTAAGFQLKGSGWYATDFKGDKSAQKSDAGEGGKTDADKSELNKSEPNKSEPIKTEASKTDSSPSESKTKSEPSAPAKPADSGTSSSASASASGAPKAAGVGRSGADR